MSLELTKALSCLKSRTWNPGRRGLERGPEQQNVAFTGGRRHGDGGGLASSSLTEGALLTDGDIKKLARNHSALGRLYDE